MITSNKLTKLMGASEEEVKQIISKMSESDAKDLLEKMIIQWNKERKSSFEI